MNNPMETHGAFSWSELYAADLEQAKSFYRDVIGWEVETMQMEAGEYTSIKAGGQPIGGLLPAEDEEPRWLSYVTVDDVRARTEKARKAGAKILRPATRVPGVGTMSTIEDPTGAALCLITYESPES